MNVLSDRTNLGPQERSMTDPVVRLIWRVKQTTSADDARQMGLSRSIASDMIVNPPRLNL